MILIHNTAIHAKVCAPYCSYSSVSVPQGQDPAAPTASAAPGNSESLLSLSLAESLPCLSMNNGVTTM